MGYYIGDIPAEDIVLEPSRNGDPMDLAPFDNVQVSLLTEDGMVLETTGFHGTVDIDGLVIEWPGVSPFLAAGLYQLQIILDGPTARERLAPLWLVVNADDGWHTLDTARADWPGAPDQDDWLHTLLTAARNEVTVYAPDLAGARPPLNYKQAQIMQARNLWNAAKVDPASGGMGEDSFYVRPFPLDWMVRQLLRPKTAIPAVG